LLNAEPKNFGWNIRRRCVTSPAPPPAWSWRAKRKNKEWSCQLEIVNLAPADPVTRDVEYPSHHPDRFELRNTEHTILLGLRYLEAKSAKLYSQKQKGWYRPTGKGEVYYFMAGHPTRTSGSQLMPK
jgi:hypothetical protein